MNAEIINIGEELLIGQVANTNGHWIAQQLNQTGFNVIQISAVSDKHEEILRILKESEQRSDLILITGGLGPTNDDVTRKALCEYFNTALVLNEQVLEDIREFFKIKGLELSRLNQDQAMVPDKAKIIRNPNGTAPGLWFEKDQKIIIATPGVPYEMQYMISEVILPELKSWAGNYHIVHKTILTQGIGESFLSDIIHPFESELPDNITLAYLPAPGLVRVRLTGKGKDEEQVRKQVELEARKLQELIPQYIWGYDRDTLQEVAGRMLLKKNKTICTAESCTGGYIAHHIISVPGSSSWYKGSVVAYSNEVKQHILGVDPYLLDKHGAVSKEVVEAMASHVLKMFSTDYSIAVSGIAGPEGGTPEKPVGTVWIAIGSKNRILSKRFQFGDSRERNILRSVLAALSMLRNFLIEE
jgi:nicotinamide-nucleotide amidase